MYLVLFLLWYFALCFIGGCQKKTDVSSKSNRLWKKHVVYDMVCEIRRKKWIKRFSKSEMKSRNASYFRNFASSCKFQCTYSFGSDHIVKENYWIKHNFTGCNDSDNEILLLYSDNVKIA